MIWSLLLLADVTGGSTAAHHAKIEQAESLFLEAYSAYARGRLEEASEGFQKVYKLFPRAPVGAIAAYNCAFLTSRLGQPEISLEWLEKAFGAGYDNFQHVESDGDLASARNMPKYQEILARARGTVTRIRAPIGRFQHREFARKLIEAARNGDGLGTFALFSRLGWLVHEPTVQALNALMRSEGYQIVNQDGSWQIDTVK